MFIRNAFLLVAVATLLPACSTVNTSALADHEVSVNIRDRGVFCNVKVETNVNSCARFDITQAQPGDICLADGSTISFKSLRKRNNQFLIVPQGANPLFSLDGQSGCPVISENGVLKCMVKNKTSQPEAFKYRVFGQGCSQSLEAHIYILGPGG